MANPRLSKTLRLRNFGQAGLNTDLAPWDLSPEYLTEGSNFRVNGQSLQSFGGYTELAELPAGFQCSHIHYVNAENDLWLFCGVDAVYAYDGATFAEVTGPALSAYYDQWTSDQLGRIPVLNNPGDFPRVWVPQSLAQPLQYLQYDASNTWSDVNLRCRSMRSFRNFLVAMGINDAGVEQPDVIQWSHPADSGGLPVSWDYNDPQYRANKVVLAGDGGDIMDGCTLRDAMAIYRERGVAMLDYVGGDYVFNIRSLTNTAALVNTNSVMEAKGVNFYISDGDIIVNDGNKIESLIHNKFRKKFASEFNAEARDNAFVLHNRAVKEAWFCVPTENSVYANQAYIYNYRDDSWSIRDLPYVPSADYGPLNTAQRTWENWQGNWENQVGTWAQGGSTPFDNMVVGVIQDTPNKIVALDIGNLSTGFMTVIERVGIPLETQQDIISVQSVYPLIEGTVPVEIQIGYQAHAGSEVVWKPYQKFTPGQQRKIDMRVTGELLSFRIRSFGEGQFSLAGIDIEYCEAGWR